MNGKSSLSQILKISEIVVNKALYPRVKENWYTIKDYSEKMKLGAIFPNITVSKHKGKYYLIDGLHRINAYKTNGVEYINCDIMTHNSMDEMFIDAVKLNSMHGLNFSFQERLRIVIRLEQMKLEPNDIARITGISKEYVKKFKNDRIAFNQSNNEVVLKKGMKSMSGITLTPEQLESNIVITGNVSQIRMISDINELFDSNSISVDNKAIRASLKKLYNHLKKVFDYPH